MNPRKRNRTSAKAAGRNFEKLVSQYLNAHVDDRIERRRQTGPKDQGDIAALRTQNGCRVVVECKNTTRPHLGPWTQEAETERQNDGALAAVIAHKRHGNANPADQYVTMTLKDFAALLTEKRPK